MTDCPTDLGAPEPPRGKLDGTVIVEPEKAGEIDLNIMIAMACLIAGGHGIKTRVPMETLIRALAMTVCKLVEDQGHG